MFTSWEDVVNKMIKNKDYHLAYTTVRAALATCPGILVLMNDEMIRRTGISNEMEIGGMPVAKDDGDCELTISARGKSGCYILMVYDRKWGAFRCAVSAAPNFDGARFFKVMPDDIHDFLYKATMA